MRVCACKVDCSVHPNLLRRISLHPRQEGRKVRIHTHIYRKTQRQGETGVMVTKRNGESERQPATEARQLRCPVGRVSRVRLGRIHDYGYTNSVVRPCGPVLSCSSRRKANHRVSLYPRAHGRSLRAAKRGKQPQYILVSPQ